MKNKRDFLKLAVFTTGVIACLSPQKANAVTWKQLTAQISQNAPLINRCLENIETKQPETPDEAVLINEEKLTDTHRCFASALQDYLVDTKVELNFQNTTFKNKVTISGKLTIRPAALQDNLITGNELTSFSLNQDLCGISHLKNFSYQLLPKAKRNFDLQYISSLLDRIIQQNPENGELIALQDSFQSLTNKNATTIMAEQLRQNAENSAQRAARRFAELSNNQSQRENPSPQLDSISTSYIESLQDSSPQLQLECESENSKLIVDNAIAEMTIIQRHTNSNSSSFPVSFGSNTQTITVNGQQLTIKTKQNNNRTQTIYQGLPLSVSGEVSIVIPEQFETETEELQEIPTPSGSAEDLI